MSEFSLQGAQEVSAQHDKGTWVVLKDSVGEPFTYTDADGVVRECKALVAGQMSTIYRKAEHLNRDKQLKRRSMTLTAETLDRHQLDVIAACVLEWNLQDKGVPIPCTKENVVKVFTAAPWMRNDIEAAIADGARFLDGAA